MPPTFDISISYEESTKTSPLIFILVSGSDPTGAMVDFAAERGMSDKIIPTTLEGNQLPNSCVIRCYS